MGYKRLTIGDLLGGGLDAKQAAFIIEYSKDFDARRAAVVAGYAADYGYKLKEEPVVNAALERILQMRLDSSHIDAEWLLMELVDNHVIARQNGNITASNTALNILAKHAAVDAFAAEKVEIAGAEQIRERLMRARKRLQDKPSDDDVSFF